MRWNDGFIAEDICLNADCGLEDQEGAVWTSTIPASSPKDRGDQRLHRSKAGCSGPL